MTADDRDRPSEAELRDLAALADGSLSLARRAELEHRLAGSPTLRAELQRQRRALASLGALREARAPARLRARIEADRGRRGRTSRPGWRRRGGAATRREGGRPRIPLRPALAGGIAAATAIGLAIALLAGGNGAPTITDAARLADREPQGAAPGPRANRPTLLAAGFEGLAFPRWEREFGWRATGTRDDRLDGRPARTVFYEKGGERIGYTIVSGEPLEAPAEAEPTTRDGVELRSLRIEGEPAVTWLRAGHTCVLAGGGVSESTLLELAAWKGGGAVAF